MFKRKPKGEVTAAFYSEALRDFNELNERLHSEYINEVQNNIKSNPAEFWNFAKLNKK